MARYNFGGSLTDFAITSPSARANAVFAQPNATGSVYAARTGGSALTDLLDSSGSATTTVSTDANGFLNRFQGPDGYTELWVDLGGGSRFFMRAIDGVNTRPGSAEKVVFVSARGNDANDGMSVNSAKLTLAAAVSALGGPGRVMVGAGTISFGATLDLSSTTNVTIEGVGGVSGGSNPATVLTFTGTGSGAAINAQHSTALTLRNLMLLYSSSSFTGRLIDARNPVTRTTDTTFLTLQDCYLGGASGVRTADALLDLDGSHSTHLIRCSFRDSVNGVRGQASAGSYANIVLLERCYFRDQTQAAIRNPGDGWAVVGCTWEPLSTGAAGAVVCDSGVSTNGFSVLGGWAGDVVASAGGIQFDLTGNDLSVVGTTVGGNTGSTGVKIRNNANGVNIAATFNGTTTGIDVSGVIPTNYDFTKSHFLSTGTPLTSGYPGASFETVSGSSAANMMIHNPSSSTSQTTIRFKSDRTSVQQWDLGIDPAGGVTKRFQLRDLTTSGSPTRFQVTPTGSVISGASAPATTATDGFQYIPVMAGTPTGTPTAETGYAPMVVDSTGSKLWVYVGGTWKSTTLA